MQETVEKSEQAELIGYPITLKKFILFDLISFGVFQRIWAFKHFRALNGPGKAKTFAAVVFAVFLPITLFGMLKNYESKSAELGLPIIFKKYLLAVTYFMIGILVNAISRVPTIPDWVTCAVGPLALIPLVIVQHKINLLNTNLRPGLPFAPRLSWQSWLCLVIAIVFLILAGIGMFFPEPVPGT